MHIFGRKGNRSGIPGRGHIVYLVKCAVGKGNLKAPVDVVAFHLIEIAFQGQIVLVDIGGVRDPHIAQVAQIGGGALFHMDPALNDAQFGAFLKEKGILVYSPSCFLQSSRTFSIVFSAVSKLSANVPRYNLIFGSVPDGLTIK